MKHKINITKNRIQTVHGYVVPALKRLQEQAYLEKTYEINKKQLMLEYKEAARRAKNFSQEAYQSFKASYPNAKAWLTKITVSEGRARNIKGIQKQLIHSFNKRFVSENTIYKENAIQGLKTYGVYEEFMFQINEDLELEKLKYEGNSVYTYITDNGKLIRLIFTNSPLSVEVVVVGDED